MQEPIPGKLYVDKKGGVYRVWAIAQSNPAGGDSYVAYGVPGSAPGFAFEAEEATSRLPVRVWMDSGRWLVETILPSDIQPNRTVTPIGWIADLRTFWNLLKFREMTQ